MTRRAVLAGAVGIVLLTLLALLMMKGTPGGASASSPGPRGWLGTRRYLEARGTTVALRTRPIDAGGMPDVLVMAFGAHRMLGRSEEPALRDWLHAGGTLVLGYSGGGLDLTEVVALHGLDLELHDLGGRPPLSPSAWRAHVDREWRLLPEPSLGPGVLDLRVRALRFVPEASREATVLFRGPAGRAVVFREARGAGRVVVLPSEVLANQRLGEPGHADLLESLREQHPGRWEFDEYRHGLGAAVEGTGAHATATFDAFVLQVVLLYVVALLSLVRRFGPAWTDPPLQSASTAAFLRGLGVQHDRRGHHAVAAERLLQRTAALHPRLTLPTTTNVRDGRGLVAFARRLAALQGGRT